ncbi:hypothetical protein Tmar_0745 [Thermaerobacter marianensis DSM 12885]|uniref:DUF4387 domain-containing protein n=1 Tax=Thermaerobacter marianensis (strain ATCC 700841 / DSM 12885 / JCM 10246 / 7p75a) TaxID=644966 RepID=E6SI82_THEM7|nr:DUF4387 domain-containing protein [Thermaerobacter marianensis]ADU50860.1 hypothetical protein Tmar_0745 [Thermaerobacter marianensis DSM 12885]
MRLRDLATTIRSKNAGVDLITFDILFPSEEAYRRACRSPVLTPESICRLLNIGPDRLYCFVRFDPARAIKFTVRRRRPAGGPGETDVFGSQQYGPLLDLEVEPDPAAPPEPPRQEASLVGAGTRGGPGERRGSAGMGER